MTKGSQANNPPVSRIKNTQRIIYLFDTLFSSVISCVLLQCLQIMLVDDSMTANVTCLSIRLSLSGEAMLALMSFFGLSMAGYGVLPMPVYFDFRCAASSFINFTSTLRVLAISNFLGVVLSLLFMLGNCLITLSSSLV